MSKRFLMASLLTAAALFMPQVSHAALLTLEGGTAYKTPPNGPGNEQADNEVIPNYWGWVGGNLYLTGVEGQKYELTFTFLGSESGYDNTLWSGLNSLPEAPGSFTITMVGGADGVLVPFEFRTPGFSPVVNGSNGGILDLRSFFVSFGGTDEDNPKTGNFLYLALDDSGAGPNDNHDDWVGTLSIRPVPEPTAVVLLGLGLLGAARSVRRRQ